MPVSKVDNPSLVADQTDPNNNMAEERLSKAHPGVGLSQYNPEPFLTIAEAADLLGVKRYALERCVRRGDVPHYTLYNSRKRVRVSEIEAFTLASRKGGK